MVFRYKGNYSAQTVGFRDNNCDRNIENAPSEYAVTVGLYSRNTVVPFM